MPNYTRALNRFNLAFGQSLQQIAPLIRQERELERAKLEKSYSEGEDYLTKLTLKVPDYPEIKEPLATYKDLLDSAKQQKTLFDPFSSGIPGMLETMGKKDDEKDKNKFIESFRREFLPYEEKLSEITDPQKAGQYSILLFDVNDDLNGNLDPETRVGLFGKLSKLAMFLGDTAKEEEANKAYNKATWADVERQNNILQQLELQGFPKARDIRVKLENKLNFARKNNSPMVLSDAENTEISNAIGSVYESTKEAPREDRNLAQNIKYVMSLASGIPKDDVEGMAKFEEFLSAVMAGEDPYQVDVNGTTIEDFAKFKTPPKPEDPKVPKVYDPLTMGGKDEYAGRNKSDFEAYINRDEKELGKVTELLLADAAGNKIKDPASGKMVDASKSSTWKRYGGKNGLIREQQNLNESLRSLRIARNKLIEVRKNDAPPMETGTTLTKVENIAKKFKENRLPPRLSAILEDLYSNTNKDKYNEARKWVFENLGLTDDEINQLIEVMYNDR